MNGEHLGRVADAAYNDAAGDTVLVSQHQCGVVLQEDLLDVVRSRQARVGYVVRL